MTTTSTIICEGLIQYYIDRMFACDTESDLSRVYYEFSDSVKWGIMTEGEYRYLRITYDERRDQIMELQQRMVI